MKIVITIIAVVVSLISIYSFKTPSKTIIKSEEGIQFFTGTWQQALDKAKKENKLIFLDAYASWCGPCKKMKHKTFTDKSVGDFYNKHFINVAIDMEKGEGPVLAEKFGVEAYPTLVFVKADGKFLGKTTGFHNVDQFLELGQKAITLK